MEENRRYELNTNIVNIFKIIDVLLTA